VVDSLSPDLNWGRVATVLAKLLGKFDFSFRSIEKLFWGTVPEALFLPGFFLSEAEQITLEALPCDILSIAALDEARKNKQRISLKIAKSACLVREVQLPKAAAGKADTAISLQVRQTMPAGGKGLVWRALPIELRGGFLIFHIFFVKQTHLDEFLADAMRHSIELVEVFIEGNEASPLWSSMPERNKKRKFWLIASVLAAVLPALWVLFSTERQISAIEQKSADTELRISTLQESLVAARDTANQAQTEGATLQQDFAAFNVQRGRVALLADLTEALPDEVWISELTVTGDQIAMAGFAKGDVTETIKLLQGLDWVGSVQLDGPISLDGYSGENRFQLIVKLRPLEQNQ
jgi:general secretion pathway protein L